MLIYLNGASSAGKTSIARLLQAELARPALYLGVDAFMEMMPAHTNAWDEPDVCAEGFSWQSVELPNGKLGMRVRSGEFGTRVEQAFRETALACARNVEQLIVDNPNGREEVERWRKLFAEHPTCFIGVVCELEELERRERARNDRIPGSAAEQYFRIHEGVHYDLVVDTTSRAPGDCVRDILAHLAEADTA